MNLNIRTKLLLFFALTVLPMIAIGALSYFNSVGAIEAVVEQRTLKAMQDLAAEVEQPLVRRQSEVALLAHNQDIQDLYARRQTKGTEALERMQERLHTAFRQFFAGPREAFARVFYLTPEGELIFSYSRTPDTGPATGLQAGFALEGDTLATSDPAFSSFDLGPYQGRDELFVSSASASAYGPILRLGRWVKNPAGQKVGFVLADLEVGRLLPESRLADSFEQNEYPVLIERENDRLLFHPQRSLIGQKVDQALPGFASVYPETSEKEGAEQYQEEGEEWLASYVSLKDVRWTFALLSPLSQSTAAVRRAGLINLGIIFAAVFLALVLSPFVIGRITGSIRQLTAGAEAIAAGDLDQEIQIRTRDETRTLAHSFNRMAQSLKTTLGDLRRLNEELEDRVQRRTSELEQSHQTVQQQNQRLEEQNRELTVERAVERMRSEVLSMQRPEDLQKVVAVMQEELKALGVDFEFSSINIIDEDAGLIREYQQLGLAQPFTMERPLIADDPVLEHWREQQAWSREHPQDTKEAWTQRLKQERNLDLDPQSTVWVVDVPFTYGTLAMNRGWNQPQSRPFSAEEIEILKHFADVVSLGYTRFLDFQRLEEQNQALEEANQQIQEATRHKSDFLSRMSHDLRTPMNAIIGYTGILRRRARGVLDERQYRNLENIQTSANNLLALINEILDLSRIEEGRQEVHLADVDLKPLAAECAALVEPLLKPEVALIQELEEVGALRTDPELLRKVLGNLLGNAVKFTEAGRITVSLRSVGAWQELCVADTGVGIPPEDLPYIFEEYHQVERKVGEKREGTGLGLAIAGKSVELLGGTISAESAVGKGTTFTVRIRDYQPE